MHPAPKSVHRGQLASGREPKDTRSLTSSDEVVVDKKPVEVPPIEPETEKEKRRYENAKLRVQSRKDLLKKIRANE